jgi:hypothetical protein
MLRQLLRSRHAAAAPVFRAPASRGIAGFAMRGGAGLVAALSVYVGYHAITRMRLTQLWRMRRFLRRRQPALTPGPLFLARDEKHRQELMRTEMSGRGKVEVSRFKGLGEMLPSQLKETTMDPRKRTLLKVVIQPEDREETSSSVERLMGNKPEARFAFIQERATFAAEKELVDI